MADAGTAVLWHYTFSNFNEKARWALDYKRIPHVRRAVVPGSPRMLRFSRGGTLPVLDLDGERIVDSTRIIETLERRWPEPPLYPQDPDERRRALELEDFFDEHVGHEFRRAAFWELRDEPGAIAELLSTGQGPVAGSFIRATLPVGMAFARRRYKIYEADAEEGRAKVEAGLDRIEAELEPSGYLVGDRFSVADLTAAALLFPIANAPEARNALPGGPLPERLAGWFASLADHPGVEWIRDMYRRHRGSSAAIRG